MTTSLSRRWLRVELRTIDSQVGRWQSRRFEIAAIYPADQEEPGALPLTLFRDERGDYRFNLSSDAPRLFVTGSRVSDSVTGEAFRPDSLSLSQAQAASYMDGDHLVLSCPLPEALQAWAEAFIGRHGELLGRPRKAKQGKGRAQDSLGVESKEIEREVGEDRPRCGAGRGLRHE